MSVAELQELEEVIIWAKLMTVNDTTPIAPVKGWVHERIDKSTERIGGIIAEHVSSRIRDIAEFIKITVKKL